MKQNGIVKNSMQMIARFSLLVVIWLLIANYARAILLGDFGIYSLGQAQAHMEELEHDIARIHQERVALENKNARLSARYLDTDLLDERARLVLGLIRADEIRLVTE